MNDYTEDWVNKHGDVAWLVTRFALPHTVLATDPPTEEEQWAVRKRKGLIEHLRNVAWGLPAYQDVSTITTSYSESASTGERVGEWRSDFTATR